MKETAFSAFMLERYRLGELEPEDRAVIDEALAADKGLRARLDELEESDRRLRLRYPRISLPARRRGFAVLHAPFPAFSKNRIHPAAIAAFIIAGILTPLLYTISARNSENGASGIDGARAKWNAPDTVELSLFLRGGADMPLADKTVLEEGNTVQLAYLIPAGDERYGVIFSIDGRSHVTVHHPYPEWRSPRMVAGRQTLLSHAYMLDDAPGFEVFVMVVSDEPLDMETVFEKAQEAAESSQPQDIIRTSKTVFEDSIVEAITVLKKEM